MALYQVDTLTGKLTRIVAGAMNSGMARIGKSKDVNPFAATTAIQFNEVATNLDPTNATVKDVIVGFAPNVESGVLYNYAVDRSGNVYKINTTNDAISLITNSLSITLKYGGGIKVITSTPSGPQQYLLIAHDAGLLYCKLDGTSSTNVPLLASGNYQTWLSSTPHPISDEFAGFIYVGNGNGLVQFEIAGIVVTSNDVIADTNGNSAIPNMYTILSLEVDGDLRYLRITITTQTNFVDIATQNPSSLSQAVLSRVLYWNGADQTYDSADPFNQANISSSYSFLGIDVSFGLDFYGPAMFSNASGAMTKVEAFQSIRPPAQGAITASSGLLFFGAPYLTTHYNGTTTAPAWVAGIFSYGVMDNEDSEPYICCQIGIPAGSSGNSIVSAVGAISVVQNNVLAANQSQLTNSKIYVSTYETGGTAAAQLYSINLTPGSGTPAPGPIETQIERFTMLQKITAVTVYQLASVSGVAWQLDLVDVDSTIPSGGSMSYTYASGSDPTQVQGSLEKIPFNPPVKDMQGLGIRVTNKGTVQPNITQIFITTQDIDSGATPN